MAVPLENLNALANSLRIVRQGPPEAQPGQPVAVSLTPLLSSLKATDVVSSLINITWLVKGVQFASQLLEDPTLNASSLTSERVVNGMPISQLIGNLTGTLTGTVTGTLGGTITGTLGGGLTEQQRTLIDSEATEPGVPGLLGQIVASLPVTAEVPVNVRVAWSVRDSDDPEGGSELSEGDDFRAPEGLSSPSASFVFAPRPVELTTILRLDELVELFLHARVELSVGDARTQWIPLPAVPVLIPRLPIPTVLALFVHRDFAAQSAEAGKGGVLCVVPTNSPLQSFTELQLALSNLLATVSTLASFTRFADFLPGLQHLTNALADHVALGEPDRVRFTSALDNRVENLEDFKFDAPLGVPLLTAEDSISSMIFIGPPKRWVDCYVKRERDAGDGLFRLTIARRADHSFGNGMYAFVRSLRPRDAKTDPLLTPTSEPTGEEVTVAKKPSGGLIENFNDELSSLEFNKS